MEGRKEYRNEDVIVGWEPAKCIHSRLCWQGLIAVFNPKRRPWIDLGAAETERIVEQVKKCPSGALSYQFLEAEEESAANNLAGIRVQVQKNGPLLIHGSIEVEDADGAMCTRENITAFCRCGQSANKPYCDGSHRSSGFSG